MFETPQIEAFEKLRSLLISEPLLAYPDFENEKLILTTGLAIGACLCQVQDDLEHPIAHASRVLSPVEKRYSTTKRGALALWEYVRKFRHYLQPKAFVVRTDHQPLKALPFKDVTAGKLAKSALTFQNLRLRSNISQERRCLWMHCLYWLDKSQKVKGYPVW